MTDKPLVNTGKRIWRAFYTRPRHEKKVAERLTEGGFDVFCPVHKVKVRWSDRWKKVTKPLFTGYVFVCVTEAERHDVLKDESVSRCLFWLGKPAEIKHEEIEAIKFLLEKAATIEVRQFKPGTKVKVTEGQLQGRSGVIKSVSKNKVWIAIEALGTEITATLTSGEVEAEA